MVLESTNYYLCILFFVAYFPQDICIFSETNVSKMLWTKNQVTTVYPR